MTCGLVLASAASEPADDGGLAWGFRAAESERRPLLVRVEASWCGLCRTMERTTYRDPGVRAEIGRFVSTRIDVEAEALFARRYGVDELPLLLILDHRGTEITRMTGVVEAQPMAERLRLVAAGYPDYVRDRRRKNDPRALQRVADYLVRSGNPEAAQKYQRRAKKRAGRCRDHDGCGSAPDVGTRRTRSE